jgi:hypothetical protein
MRTTAANAPKFRSHRFKSIVAKRIDLLNLSPPRSTDRSGDPRQDARATVFQLYRNRAREFRRRGNIACGRLSSGHTIRSTC